MTSQLLTSSFTLNVSSKEAIYTAIELLEKNSNQYNCFFNDSGFHNHITHDILASLALGASKKQLKLNFEKNATYQRQLPKAKDVNLNDEGVWENCLGRPEYYRDFRDFFMREIEQQGVPFVFKKYLLEKNKKFPI